MRRKNKWTNESIKELIDKWRNEETNESMNDLHMKKGTQNKIYSTHTNEQN